MTAILVGLCAAACFGLLLSEYRGSRIGRWLCKPLAAAAFVGVGLVAGGLESEYGRWIVLGLCLSWVGDVLLIPTEREALFLAGIGSFLAAHLAYCAAFLSLGPSGWALSVAAVLLIAGAVIAVAWLRPHLSGPFRRAVPAYVGVIATMVALSGGAAVASGRPALCAGAVLFAISDLSVARDRFISPGFANAAWGLPLYFAAQVVLALSVAGPS